MLRSRKSRRLAFVVAAFAVCTLSTSAVLLSEPEVSVAYRVPLPEGETPFLEAQDFIAAGQQVPGTHPALPVCPPAAPDPGFATAADVARAKAVVGRGPATCQIDRSTGVFQERPALPPVTGQVKPHFHLRTKPPGRSISHSGSTAYHWSGPATTSITSTESRV